LEQEAEMRFFFLFVAVIPGFYLLAQMA